MPVIPKVAPDLKLDYFIQFTLQHKIGEAFDARCKELGKTKQQMLRMLVDSLQDPRQEMSQ
jgi:hypothetical protein